MDNTNTIMQDFTNFGINSHSLPNALGMWMEEAEYLVQTALQAGEKDWLEIGSFCGGSTVLLCLTRKFRNLGPRVVSVDINFNPFFDMNVYNRGNFQDINQKLEIDSNEIALHLENDLSLAFIDGFHSFRQVVDDFTNIQDFLTDDAIVLFHDCSPFFGLESDKEECLRFVNRNFDMLMNSKEQDFRLNEAVYYICEEYGYEEVKDIPKQKAEHFTETNLNKWVRTTTSPFHSIVSIRKPK